MKVSKIRWRVNELIIVKMIVNFFCMFIQIGLLYSFEHVHQRGLAEPLATMHSSVQPHARQVGPIPVDLKQ